MHENTECWNWDFTSSVATCLWSSTEEFCFRPSCPSLLLLSFLLSPTLLLDLGSLKQITRICRECTTWTIYYQVFSWISLALPILSCRCSLNGASFQYAACEILLILVRVWVHNWTLPRFTTTAQRMLLQLWNVCKLLKWLQGNLLKLLLSSWGWVRCLL